MKARRREKRKREREEMGRYKEERRRVRERKREDERVERKRKTKFLKSTRSVYCHRNSASYMSYASASEQLECLSNEHTVAIIETETQDVAAVYNNSGCNHLCTLHVLHKDTSSNKHSVVELHS